MMGIPQLTRMKADGNRVNKEYFHKFEKQN